MHSFLAARVRGFDRLSGRQGRGGLRGEETTTEVWSGVLLANVMVVVADICCQGRAVGHGEACHTVTPLGWAHNSTPIFIRGN